MINTLEIERINTSDFKVVKDKEINCSVVFFDKWSRHNSVKGKGSRKYKESILQAISNYIDTEIKKNREKQETELKEKLQSLRDSEAFKEIDLLQLYEVVLMEQEYDSYDYRKSKGLLTGLEVKDDLYNVIEFKEHTINNTSIYGLGSDSFYERKSVTDDRFFIIGIAKYAYVTGLALKEMLHDGMKSHGNIRLVEDIELRSILNTGKANASTVLLTDFTSSSHQANMGDRIQKELERAEKGKIRLSESRFTDDGKPIKKAFFASKPTSFKEIKNKYLATYDSYVVGESIMIDKELFDIFKESLDMTILPIDFKGGTNSTYKGLGLDDTNDLYNNSEIKQQKWIDGAYNLALKVLCDDYDYSLLVDPQGYDYGRYAALIENN